jgi:hypothetical protein
MKTIITKGHVWNGQYFEKKDKILNYKLIEDLINEDS